MVNVPTLANAIPHPMEEDEPVDEPTLPGEDEAPHGHFGDHIPTEWAFLQDPTDWEAWPNEEPDGGVPESKEELRMENLSPSTRRFLQPEVYCSEAETSSPEVYAVTAVTKVEVIIDSGADLHCTGDERFKPFCGQPPNFSIATASGEIIKPEGYGSVMVTTEEGSAIPLTNIHFVPGLKKTLLSTSMLARDGVVVQYEQGEYYLKKLYPEDPRRAPTLIALEPGFRLMVYLDAPVTGVLAIQHSFKTFRVGDRVKVHYTYFNGEPAPPDGHFHGGITGLGRVHSDASQTYKILFDDQTRRTIREVDLQASDTWPLPVTSKEVNKRKRKAKKANTPLVVEITRQSAVTDIRHHPEHVPVPPDTTMNAKPVPLAEPQTQTLQFIPPGGASVAPEKSAIDQLHLKFGHASEDILKKLGEWDKAYLLPASAKLSPCNSCNMMKYTRTPSKAAKPVYPTARNPMHVVHSDSGGKLPVSLQKHSYYHLMVDAYSRYIWIIPTKNLTSQALQRAVTTLRTDTGRYPEHLHSDNGSEYRSAQTNLFCLDRSIAQTFSAPNHHDENGVAERTQRSIWEIARTMMYDASAPPEFWEYALTYAVFTKNVTLSKKNDWCSAHERIFMSRPVSLANSLHRWGCTVYTMASQVASKFDPRAVKCMFLGIAADSTSHTYIVGHFYNDGTSDGFLTYRSSDVKFIENDNYLSPLENPDLLPNPMEGHGPVETSEDDTVSESYIPPTSPIAPVAPPPTVASSDPEDFPAEEYHEVYSLTQVPAPDEDYTDPRNSKEAALRPAPEAAEWSLGEDKEWLHNVVPNACEIVDAAEAKDHKIIPTAFVYKLKPAVPSLNKAKQYKVRAVVRGNLEDPANIGQVFAPTIPTAVVRMLFIIAYSKQFRALKVNVVVRSGDVTNAFCLALLPADKVVFIHPPLARYRLPGKVFKLKSALYGLAESPRLWYETFYKLIMEIGYLQSEIEPCLFYKISPDGTLVCMLIIFVDDCLFAGPLAEWELTVAFLQSRIPFKDLGQPDRFLGLNLDFSADGVMISHHEYIAKILKRFDLTNANPVRTPMDPKSNLQRPTEPLSNPALYQAMVGSLMHHAVYFNSAIVYAVKELSRYMLAHDATHVTAAKRVFRYLRGTSQNGYFVSLNGNLDIQTYVDANWAPKSETRRSTTGFLQLIDGIPVVASAKEQKSIALSTCEAELFGISQAARFLSWQYAVLRELFLIPESFCFVIQTDSQSAIDLVNNNAAQIAAKHIDIRLKHIREQISRGRIALKHVSSADNLADICTKPLPIDAFAHISSRLFRTRATLGGC